MKKLLNIQKLFLLFFSMLIIGSVNAADSELPVNANIPPQASQDKEYSEDVILVKFKRKIANNPQQVMKGKMMRELKAKNKNKVKAERLFPQHAEKAEAGQWYRITLPEKANIKALINRFKNDPDVVNAEPDYAVSLNAIPGDPMFPELWGLHNTGQNEGKVDADIDAPEAWDISQGSDQVVIAVIDSGVAYYHEDLADNMWVNTGEIPDNGTDDDGNGYIDDVHGYDSIGRPDLPDIDFLGHGTHVAGTIAAVGNNGIGISGVSWNSKIMNVRFLSGRGVGYTSDAIACIHYAILMGADIINASWGGIRYSQALYDAISAANDANILFVASSGNRINDNDQAPHYPSSYELPNIVSVSATNRDDKLAYFSNWGMESVHVTAPGRHILSTVPEGYCRLCDFSGYRQLSGTSMSAPHISGAAALLLSLNPDATVSEIKEALIRATDPIAKMKYYSQSEGRFNLEKLLSNNLYFKISGLTTPITLDPGATASSTFDVSALSAYNGPVQLALTSTVPDITLSLDKSQVDPVTSNESVTVTATAAPGTHGGPYTFDIVGVDSLGNEQHRTISMHVTGEDFAISVTPNFQLAHPGDSATYQVEVSSLSGFSGEVSLDTELNNTNESFSFTQNTLTVPTNGSANTTLSISSDPLGEIGETGYIVTANDGVVERSDIVRISSRFYDLQYDQVIVPDRLPADGIVPLSYTISNQGNITTPSFYSDAYLRGADGTLYYIGEQHAWMGSRKLAPGESFSRDMTLEVTVPDDIPLGQYELMIAIAYSYRVLEYDPEDNIYTKMIELVPNLTEMAIDSFQPDRAFAGLNGYARMSYTVSNHGEFDANEHLLGIYLSPDPIITTDDLIIGSRPIDRLNTGQAKSYRSTPIIPSSVVPGDYYIGVIVDKNNVFTEQNKLDNVAYQPITILDVDYDLIVETVDTHVTAVSQLERFFVTSNTKNVGSNSTETDIALYLSTDNVIDQSDYLLADLEASGDGYYVTVPIEVPAANYYIGAIADPNNLVAETYEDNNTLVGPMITVNTVADIQIVSLNAPTISAPSGSFDAELTLYNAGGGNTGWTRHALYLSEDAVITTEDTLLDSKSSTNIFGLSTETVNFSATLPSTMALGNYYLGVITDTEGVVIESNENNNQHSQAIEIRSTASDLTILNISYTRDFFHNYTITTLLDNIGSTPVTDVPVGFYLSTDSNITTSDIYLGEVISSNDYGNISGTFAAPPAISGTYYVGAIVDPNNTIEEINEVNNSAVDSQTTELFTNPDLLITDFTAPAQGEAGVSINLSYVRWNQGQEGTWASYACVYLSTDSEVTTADMEIHAENDRNIAPHSSRSFSINAVIPIDQAPGNYYIAVIADCRNWVVEGDEDNNVSEVYPISVTPASYNLTITEVETNYSAQYAGNPIPLNSKVKQIGALKVSHPIVGYYLSADQNITPEDYPLGEVTVIYNSGYSSISGMIPSNIPPGTYYIGAYADPGNSVAESDETNNGLHGTTIVVYPPWGS